MPEKSVPGKCKFKRCQKEERKLGKKSAIFPLPGNSELVRTGYSLVFILGCWLCSFTIPYYLLSITSMNRFQLKVILEEQPKDSRVQRRALRCKKTICYLWFIIVLFLNSQSVRKRAETNITWRKLIIMHFKYKIPNCAAQNSVFVCTNRFSISKHTKERAFKLCFYL